MLVRVIGAFIGFNLLGIFGAFLGWFVAGGIERYIRFGSGAVNPLSAGQRQAVFLQTVFSLMGRLAKADGHISAAEIAHTEQVIEQLGMTEQHRQQAIDYFRAGAQPGFAMQPLLQEFNAVCGHTLNLRQMLLIFLLGLAHADGVFDAAEHALLQEIANSLGYGASEFEALLRRTQSQSGFSGHQNRASSSLSALAEAYKALGVDRSASDAEVKKAYRKLMSEFHPDKLTGQGMPEDMVKMATERSKEITAAYELIKQNRK